MAGVATPTTVPDRAMPTPTAAAASLLSFTILPLDLKRYRRLVWPAGMQSRTWILPVDVRRKDQTWDGSWKA
jgi:hypothetical protein